MDVDNNTRDSSNHVVVGFLFPNLLLRLLGLILLAHGHKVSKKGSQADSNLVCLQNILLISSIVVVVGGVP